MSAVELYLTCARVVARERDLPIDAVLMPRGRYARSARHVAMYIAHVGCGVPVRRVARLAGVNQRDLRRVFNAVEERRECRRFDEAVETMERSAADAAHAE